MQNKPFLKTFQVRSPARARERRLPPVPRMCAALALRREAESHFRKITPTHPAATLLDDGRSDIGAES
jgi:hypothetical protein